MINSNYELSFTNVKVLDKFSYESQYPFTIVHQKDLKYYQQLSFYAQDPRQPNQIGLELPNTPAQMWAGDNAVRKGTRSDTE